MDFKLLSSKFTNLASHCNIVDIYIKRLSLRLSLLKPTKPILPELKTISFSWSDHQSGYSPHPHPLNEIFLVLLSANYFPFTLMGGEGHGERLVSFLRKQHSDPCGVSTHTKRHITPRDSVSQITSQEMLNKMQTLGKLSEKRKMAWRYSFSDEADSSLTENTVKRW